MSSELTTIISRPPSVAPATTVSPWREAVNDEVGANFGTFLKFNKGDWLLGEEAKKIEGETFIVNMEEYYRGWVRWWDGKPTDHVLGRVVDRHRVQAREELGDLNDSQWETEPNGARRDPWAKTVYLVMRDAEGMIVCFTASSDGGRRAVALLADRYDRLRHRHKTQMPVVGLDSECYDHRVYGKILKPKFRLVDWAYWDEETPADPGGALQLQHAAEMDEEIPF